MLLVKNCNFFSLFVFCQNKTRTRAIIIMALGLEIMFNNVLDRKEIFFGNKNFKLFQFQNFSKRANACFWSKNVFFFWLELFSVKIRLEIMFNNTLDTKATFLSRKKIQSFKVPKVAFSQRG